MKKYELYNQALKQMKQLEQEKAQARKTVEELCAEWNWTLSDKEAQVVNSITINKGKIVAVDNTNEEYIEQLLKDLQNRNERIEQLKEQLKKEQQDYRDLEVQDLEELEYADKEIKQLRNEVKVYKGMAAGYEAQLQNKDLTIESLEKQIADMKEDQLRKEMKNDVAAYDDMIEELNLQIDIQKEELEYYHNKEKEYEEDVEGMEMDIEALKLQMEGMRFAYENQIAALKAEIAELTKPVRQWELVDDPMFNDVEEEETVADVEGGVAMPQFMDIPDKYKDHPEIIETIKDFTEKWNNAEEIRAAGLTREQVQESHVIAANQTLETIIAELEEADKYHISFTKLLNDKNQTVVAVVGRITLGGQEYPFKYGATHKLPCIYGCYDEALIEEAKEALDNAIHMIKDETTVKHAYDVVYEMNKGIVVWQTDDGAFKGYARAKSQRNGKRNSYAFVWDGTSAEPTGCWCDHMYVRQDNGQHMTTDEFVPMNRRWGAGIASLGQEIMAFCKTIDKKETRETKEIENETKEVVNETKEEKLNVAQEVEDLDI